MYFLSRDGIKYQTEVFLVIVHERYQINDMVLRDTEHAIQITGSLPHLLSKQGIYVIH